MEKQWYYPGASVQSKWNCPNPLIVMFDQRLSTLYDGRNITNLKEPELREFIMGVQDDIKKYGNKSGSNSLWAEICMLKEALAVQKKAFNELAYDIQKAAGHTQGTANMTIQAARAEAENMMLRRANKEVEAALSEANALNATLQRQLEESTRVLHENSCKYQSVLDQLENERGFNKLLKEVKPTDHSQGVNPRKITFDIQRKDKPDVFVEVALPVIDSIVICKEGFKVHLKPYKWENGNGPESLIVHVTNNGFPIFHSLVDVSGGRKSVMVRSDADQKAVDNMGEIVGFFSSILHGGRFMI